MLAPLILASLLVVVGLLAFRTRGREARRGALGPLRVLLPSWRFFDRAGPHFRLTVRAGSTAHELGAYHEVHLPTPTRHRLLLDAAGNFRLAYHTLLERLIDDLSALEGRAATSTVEQLVSYELVVNLVRYHLPAASGEGAPRYFQFILAMRCDPTDPEVDVLTSAVHTV